MKIDSRQAGGTILVALLSISASPLARAGICTAEGILPGLDAMAPHTFSFLNNIGGVTLNKTLEVLNSVDEIHGAAYDPAKGEIVFAGQGEIPLAERIDLDDLAVAIRSVYGMNADPGITFYSTSESMAGGALDVTYFGATRNTEFGRILFEADFLLKQLTLGINPSGQKLTALQPELATLVKQAS